MVQGAPQRRELSSPADSKVGRDKEATKDRLVGAVGSLLSKGGFGALGVNAVAEEAGVDKVLIYRYFGGMDDLLKAFGKSGDFWPSIAEVIGEDPSHLLQKPLAERWAIGLKRYADALRRRPVTKEILAWEQIEQNELIQVLREAREEWFEELLTHFPDDSEATDTDLVTTVLVIVGAIHYFVVLGRLQDDFSGIAIGADEGWEVIDSVITTIFERTLRSTS